MKDFKDKVAVITGGASGIGFAIAESFAAEGMKLVVADLEPGALDRACTALSARGANVIGVLTDVSKRESQEALLAATLKAFGAVHVLCSNAGVTLSGPTWLLTEQDWKWILGVNLWGVVHGIGVFVPQMLEQRDECHVVNTASMGGFASLPFMSAYQATKFGVVTISETLANELAMYGADIGVSVLCPAFVKSNLHQAERNRPKELDGGSLIDADSQRAIKDVVTKLVNEGIAPSQVAQAVMTGIRERAMYIFTHPETAPQVKERQDAILSALVKSGVVEE